MLYYTEMARTLSKTEHTPPRLSTIVVPDGVIIVDNVPDVRTDKSVRTYRMDNEVTRPHDGLATSEYDNRELTETEHIFYHGRHNSYTVMRAKEQPLVIKLRKSG